MTNAPSLSGWGAFRCAWGRLRREGGFAVLRPARLRGCICGGTLCNVPHLPPEIIAVLLRTAEETMARHVPTDDGRCSYCALTWLHTDTAYPCPPVRIAAEFQRLTDS